MTVGLSVEDFSYARQFFRPPKWRLEGFETVAAAAGYLDADPATGVVLCADSLPGGRWCDLWHRSQSRPRPPVLIVVSRRANEEMWAEVLNEGAYDLLAAPFEGDELFQVVGLAWHSWLRQGAARAGNGTIAFGVA